jgi:adenylate cyclase
MFRFEGYTLDIARNALQTADREVALRPKNFELLRYLVENPDRLVTKEELLKAIWPNVTVADQVLSHCVSEVREAIGDTDQAIIKTIPRRGYRFVAPVVRVAESASAAPGTVGVSPALSESAGETPAFPGRVGDRPSVAVLPFANLSGDPQLDYFSDGIADDIITELSRFSELVVIARNSSFQYRGKAVDIRQVARELGALYILEGSVKRSGGRVRTTA